jgi:hypothetical protein
MIHLFKEIRILKDEGKLHARLISRTRMLFIISLLLLLAVLFNIIWRHAGLYTTLATIPIAVIGFFLGFYLFSQMNVVGWNEEEEVVKSGKMDTVGFISLGLYILFEITFRTYLKSHFPTTAIPLLLSGICGTLLGRATGTLAEIHKAYLARHNP